VDSETPVQETLACSLPGTVLGGPGPKLDITLANRDLLVHLYREMLFMRRFEERVGEMYTRARIGGYTHLNIGEEAAIVGALDVLRPRDYVYSNYREHGHALMHGVPPSAIMAELFGKATGTSKGRGGSMHLFDAKHRFMGGYAIVGGSLPLAAGAAFAVKYRQSEEVVAVLFGDGSTNIGAFYETLNWAKLERIPLVFLCVNNQYAMGDRTEQDSSVPQVYRKACAFDMRAERVDGLDVLAVREAAERFIKYTREAQDPTLLELFCYRLRGHSMADPARYRTAEEVQSWVARDPILHFREQLEQAGILSTADIRSLDQEVDEGVAEAVNFAEQSPNPDPATLFESIYADRPFRV
jgi:pyruvate dehydrogenase E1 component alpha subunit